MERLRVRSQMLLTLEYLGKLTWVNVENERAAGRRQAMAETTEEALVETAEEAQVKP